jgi:hypothetical protein
LIAHQIAASAGRAGSLIATPRYFEAEVRKIAVRPPRALGRSATRTGNRKDHYHERGTASHGPYPEMSLRAVWQAKEGRNARSANTLARHDPLAKIDAMISGRDKIVSKFEQQPDLAARSLNAVPMHGSAR